jgi:hypothetical protein
MARQLVPLRKIDPDKHGIPFSPSKLDWINFYREYNGAAAAGALLKCGGRIYVDPEKFLEWMATNPRISPPVLRSTSTNRPDAVVAPALRALGSNLSASAPSRVSNRSRNKRAEVNRHRPAVLRVAGS